MKSMRKVAVRWWTKASDGSDKLIGSMGEEELLGWFKSHSNPDGTITDEITLFAKATLDVRDTKGGPVPWMLTDMELDREQERVDPAGADLTDYRENPVILWGHEYPRPAIGQMHDLKVVDKQLVGKVDLDPAEVDPFAGMIRAKVERQTIRAGSIGFQPKTIEIIEDEKDPTRLIHRKWGLLEFSLCNVPMHPGALARPMESEEEAKPESAEKTMDTVSGAMVPGVVTETVKAVIPYRDYGTAEEDAAWDGPAQVREAEPEVLKAICTWYDAEEPDAKSSYKLPHHRASDKKAVWRGVASAMTALLGGRGGVDIPEGDRRGVYSHLAKHYRQFEKEPPDFKSGYQIILDRLVELEGKIQTEPKRQEAYAILFGEAPSKTRTAEPKDTLLFGEAKAKPRPAGDEQVAESAEVQFMKEAQDA